MDGSVVWGYRIVPDGRIDLKPVSQEHLDNCMRLASVPEDAAAELKDGHIVYVNSMEMAKRIIAVAGLTNWGLVDETESTGEEE